MLKEIVFLVIGRLDKLRLMYIGNCYKYEKYNFVKNLSY